MIRTLVATLALAAIGLGEARAQEAPLTGILDEGYGFHVDSVRVRYTRFDQTGLGYQSQAGPLRGPGLEEATIDQPQVEIVAHQGPRVTHRLWVPMDVVSAASPDAIDGWPPKQMDAITEASRINEAGTLDLTTTYQLDRATTISMHTGFHLEEEWRSWMMGGAITRSMADDNAVLSVSVNQVFDWFDEFRIDGERLGHTTRSSTNANLGLTQLLSPTTVANLNYGVTVQLGTLGNTWNAVPLRETTGDNECQIGLLGCEHLPSLRQRHAFVARLAQYLPWQGAIHGFYRFYVDDWGLTAHTLEAELYQRIGPAFYLRANYRFHWQSGVDFWTSSAPSDTPASQPLRTADSDLQGFYAQTFGLKASLDLPLVGKVREVHVDVGFERYVRSNQLNASIVSASLGLRFR